MGLEKVAFNFIVERGGKLAKSLLCSKPQKAVTNIKGLTYKTSAYDTVQLSNISYLSASFIKSLAQIKTKDKLETMVKIKDTILRKMGYKNPELLQIENFPILTQITGVAGAGWNNESGKMLVSKHILNSSIEDMISTLYHELDHMDKFIKLYKTTGKKIYYEIIAKSMGGERIPKINWDFFQKMSKDVDVTSFDVNKYAKAAREYEGVGFRLSEQYKYFNNPFEVSAYNLESKIKNILGSSTISPRDVFPQNYDSLIEALKKQGIKDALQQDEILLKLIEICKMKYIDKNMVNLYRNAINGTATSEEYEILKNIDAKILEDMKNNPKKVVSNIQRACLDAETFINKGLLTVDDVVNNMKI